MKKVVRKIISMALVIRWNISKPLYSLTGMENVKHE